MKGKGLLKMNLHSVNMLSGSKQLSRFAKVELQGVGLLEMFLQQEILK